MELLKTIDELKKFMISTKEDILLAIKDAGTSIQEVASLEYDSFVDKVRAIAKVNLDEISVNMKDLRVQQELLEENIETAKEKLRLFSEGISTQELLLRERIDQILEENGRFIDSYARYKLEKLRDILVKDIKEDFTKHSNQLRARAKTVEKNVAKVNYKMNQVSVDIDKGLKSVLATRDCLLEDIAQKHEAERVKTKNIVKSSIRKKAQENKQK